MRMLGLLVIASGLTLAGCATDSTMGGAATGAAVGALAGAVIGNNTGSGDAGDGALVGGLIGGIAGAAYGNCREGGGCGGPGGQNRGAQHNNGQQSDMLYDSQAGRYYYIDRQTGDTYWQGGELRTRAPRY
ncbi:glycine zipper domain-containing protein [Woodsholea maritima]|uniref:glycine zipper domain-containing protein n=1 Tax=Woodsholea maritima TaxID=240237 RepID=UPI000364F596|nr:glycine zipper domain-containing protein [Woodsholea maritima]